MSDPEKNSGERIPAPPTAGWYVFHEKTCMVQLRQPYIGCNMNHVPTIDQETGNVRAAPVLSGTLNVESDGAGGVLLVLAQENGLPNGATAFISMRPEDVVFVTHIHRPLITQ